MAATDSNLAENIENVLKELQGYLHSEMSVSESEEDNAGVIIIIRNDAPPREDGGQIVFTGVGMRVIDGSERFVSNPPKWTRNIQKTRPSDQEKIRQQYQKGVWVRGVEFEPVTSNEQTFGETLFPGESVTYEMQISKKSLPSTEIRVEGAVSRRHLFHISRVISGLEKWGEPAIAETLRALNTVDIRRLLITATDAMPDFRSKTTLEEVNAFKGIVEEAKSLIKPTMQALNEVYHSAPNQELRDHMKQNVGHYLTSLEKTFTNTLDALASGNAEQMREATDSLKDYLAASEEVNQKTVELMTRYGVSLEKAN